jgi:hypothetical protein
MMMMMMSSQSIKVVAMAVLYAAGADSMNKIILKPQACGRLDSSRWSTCHLHLRMAATFRSQHALYTSFSQDELAQTIASIRSATPAAVLPLGYYQAHPEEVCSRRAQTHMHASHRPAMNGTRMHASAQRHQRQVARQNEAAGRRHAVIYLTIKLYSLDTGVAGDSTRSIAPEPAEMLGAIQGIPRRHMQATQEHDNG